MRLTFLGAAGTVTGSKYLVEANNRQILVDCGLFQGYKPLRLRNWAPFPIPGNAVDAVVLTHAHLDHSGYLPRLASHGFKGPVVASEATRELCRILLPDSGRLQEEEADYANRRGFSKHKPALPLYTEADAQRALERFEALPFQQARELLPGVRINLHPAGHMLGAAIVEVQAEGKSLVFSGDLGRPNDPIIVAPSAIEHADYLVVESTYGDRRHAGLNPETMLAEVIRRTAARGGMVVIPAFAVGRAQAVMYSIYRLKQAGAIPDLPVFLNSPMATDATEIYHRFRREHRLSPEECTGMCGAAKIVRTVEESRALNNLRYPSVIIAASGMATGGRVLHHLRAYAPDHKNTLLFPGFQAGGTRGALIVGGAPAVKIHGEEVAIRAEVVHLDQYSAHADYEEILAWLKGFRTPPRHTFVTHGELGAADAMRRRIGSTLAWQASCPEHLQSVALND